MPLFLLIFSLFIPTDTSNAFVLKVHSLSVNPVAPRMDSQASELLLDYLLLYSHLRPIFNPFPWLYWSLLNPSVVWKGLISALILPVLLSRAVISTLRESGVAEWNWEHIVKRWLIREDEETHISIPVTCTLESFPETHTYTQTHIHMLSFA